MFHGLYLPNSTALFTIAAFSVAASIFVTVAWRALGMRRPQIDRLSQLPFETATPASHAPKPESTPDRA
jgi:hypothetical protein